MMVPTTNTLVLITGVTGHIGFKTLLFALNSGFTVRAAVRSNSKAQNILNHPKIQSLAPGPRLTFITVPDLTAPHAYDAAVEGVTHIIHIASPLRISSGTDDEIPLNEQDAYFIQPAIRGTTSMLDAAHASQTVRRIVITSSLTALIPFDALVGDAPLPAEPITPASRVELTEGPYLNEFEAYAASKVAALAHAEEWLASHPSRQFDCIHLHPGFVQGRNELATSAREVFGGTNKLVLGMVLGKTFEAPIAGATVHVDDVARIHVQALSPFVPGDMGYILSQATEWDDAKTFVSKHFGGAVEKRVVPNTGHIETTRVNVDNGLTEDVFGRLAGFEEQVKSVVGHYVELRMKGMARRKRESKRPAAQQEAVRHAIATV
ncbi:NAD(P)-binding protein [Microthyrium microscopicum]|uniref:NAD(P)-binding protein n=1 Tax=Microthyrium microscopicum TaxID=703497 RepID=A0A6A6U065_9PEZI|nr:NAD(P)-binding protein [Microthyrium microscopicum]